MLESYTKLKRTLLFKLNHINNLHLQLSIFS